MTPRVSVPMLSPSLLPRVASTAAFELKFLLRLEQARQFSDWTVRDEAESGLNHLDLRPDPHGDPALEGAYDVASIYFDTPAWDVFHRSPGFRRRKYRLRRYGDSEPIVYLERKTKSRGRVSKQRTPVAPADLPRLCDEDPDPNWSGCWFQRRLLARQLRPACLVRYRRTALVGSNDHGPVRLTLDRQIRCLPYQDFSFAPLTAPSKTPTVNWLPILTDAMVLELKFRTVLPTQFKALIEQLRLSPTAVSKYRAAIDACGLALARREVG